MVAEAVLVPVGPALGWGESQPSPVVCRLPAEETASPRSVMPGGGVIELPPPMSNSPTISSPLTVVVIDGAVMAVGAVLGGRPPWAAVRPAVFTPGESRVPPAAAPGAGE